MDDLVRPFLDLCCSCFCRELGNNTDLDENLNALNREIEKLREEEEGVRARVDFAETRLRRTPRRDVNEWLERVQALGEEIAGIREEREALEQPLPSWRQAPGRWLRRCRLSGRVATALRMARFLRRHGRRLTDGLWAAAGVPRSPPRRRASGGAMQAVVPLEREAE